MQVLDDKNEVSLVTSDEGQLTPSSFEQWWEKRSVLLLPEATWYTSQLCSGQCFSLRHMKLPVCHSLGCEGNYGLGVPGMGAGNRGGAQRE